MTIAVVLAFAAVFFGAGGTYVLAGLGWTLVFLSVACAAGVVCLARGVRSDG